MDKQQSSTVQYIELYSISYDKPQWKITFLKEYIYIYIYIYMYVCMYN